MAPPSGLVWADDEDDEPAFACLIGNVPTSLAEADVRDLIGELKVMFSLERDLPLVPCVLLPNAPVKALAIITFASVSCAQISGLRAIEGERERAHTWRVELTTEADLKSAINTMNGVRVCGPAPRAVPPAYRIYYVLQLQWDFTPGTRRRLLPDAALFLLVAILFGVQDVGQGRCVTGSPCVRHA